MHSSRMRTACSMTGRISAGCIPRMTPLFATPPLSPHMPNLCHACPPFATHAPLCHACPPLPHMPPLCHTCPPHHACPPSNHACPPGATTHTPQEQPRMPPRATMHTPHLHPPGATTHGPPVNRITDRCKNITFANYVCGR